MLAHLFLWYYSLIIFTCNGLQTLNNIEGKSSTRKYRNPDNDHKQHIVSHSPKMLPGGLEDNAISSTNIKNLISKLRDNWQPPATYLKKRGYLNKKRSGNRPEHQRKLIDSHDYLKDINSLKKQMRKYHDHKNIFKQEFSEMAATHPKGSHGKISGLQSISKDFTKRLTSEGRFHYLPHSNSKIKKDSNAQSSSKGTSLPDSDLIVATCGGPTKKSEFMARIKDKFQSMFKPNKNISLRDDFEMYNDILNEEDADNINIRKTKQKLFNIKFDGSRLNQDDAGTVEVQKRSSDCQTSALKGENSTSGEESSTWSDSARKEPSGLDLKFGDVMKNLTQADMDYVKSFLKCYKENKQKFYVDYLHMNKTMVNEASRKYSEPKQKNPQNKDGLCKAAKSEMGLKIPKTNGSQSEVLTKKINTKITEAKTSTTPAPAKEEDTIELDFDVKTNATGEEAENKSCTPLKRKIPATQTLAPATLKFPKKIKCEKDENTPYTSSTIPPHSAEVEAAEESLLTTSSTLTTLDPLDQSTEMSGYSPFSNVLKFLAHQHHPVDEVGKLPHKPLNLTRIQQMIDDARQTLAIVVLGNENSNNNDTKCTPLGFNEVDSDVEWTAPQDLSQQRHQSIRGVDNSREDSIYDIIGSDSVAKELDRSPYSDIIDQPQNDVLLLDHKYQAPIPFSILKKKRETARPEESSLQDSEDKPMLVNDYSDLIPSLDDFLSGSKQSLLLDQYIDDYHMDGPRKRMNPHGIEDDDSNEGDSNDESELFGRKKKRKRKKKKKKKYNKKNSNVAEDPVEFVVETDILPTIEREQIEDTVEDKEKEPETLNDDGSQNDYLKFAELSDAKFRVSPDQEEDIKKFIDGLNEPPEVFNFDVEKYLKPKDVSEPINYDSVAPKTFYEFVDSPRVENEQVPLIAPELGEVQPLPQPDVEAETSPKDNRSSSGKRDVLRQFIKGLSDHIHDDTKKLPLDEKSASKVDDGGNVDPVDHERALISNYANNLDVLNYGRFEPEEKGPAADDFVDNFYLLNDGSFSIYGAEKPVEHVEEKYSMDPFDLGIDLDLERKFKDLHVPEASVHPVGKCNGMDCSQDKELNMDPVMFDNLGMRYIPDSVYHKHSEAGKTYGNSLDGR